MTFISAQKMYIELVKFVSRAGSQKEAARMLEVSEPYLSDVLRMRRDITNTISQALGYKKKVVYEHMDTHFYSCDRCGKRIKGGIRQDVDVVLCAECVIEDLRKVWE